MNTTRSTTASRLLENHLRLGVRIEELSQKADEIKVEINSLTYYHKWLTRRLEAIAPTDDD